MRIRLRFPVLALFVMVVAVWPGSVRAAGGAYGNVAAARAAQAQAAANRNAVIGDYGSLVRAIDEGHVRSAIIDQSKNLLLVRIGNAKPRYVTYPADDGSLPLRLGRAGASVRLAALSPPGWSRSSSYWSWLTPVFLVGGMALLFLTTLCVKNARQRRNGGGGGGKPEAKAARSAGDSPLRETRITASDVRFSDVAGCDEVVEELSEIVEFLASPERFTRLGARIPTGVLMYGPPGTGKTLIAKAVAGESGAAFFSASGSDFVEMYVGVGAKRIRELFAKARAAAPAIIFLDELDSVGRARGEQGGNGESDQTLNALLVELDGFQNGERAAVCVIAATNRKDILDPALLRPGRLTRHVAVPLPAQDGRLSILGVHAAGKPLAADVDLNAIAEFTHGFSGAQLGEVLNEAAILAAREHADEIRNAHVQEAVRRVLAGPKRRSAPIGEGELEVIAHHEAGHVICAARAGHDKARHVTIEPRDNAMGFALYGSTDKALHDERSLHAAMVAALGGRAAEQLVFNRVSSGASNDLEKTHALARTGIEQFGFSERVGQTVGDLRSLSDERRVMIEEEIHRLVNAAYADALQILTKERSLLDQMATTLLDRKELDLAAIEELLGSDDAPALAYA